MAQVLVALYSLKCLYLIIPSHSIYIFYYHWRNHLNLSQCVSVAVRHLIFFLNIYFCNWVYNYLHHFRWKHYFLFCFICYYNTDWGFASEIFLNLYNSKNYFVHAKNSKESNFHLFKGFNYSCYCIQNQ